MNQNLWICPHSLLQMPSPLPTSCANFNFRGISFQAASTAHNVHEVNGRPGKRHPVLPESLAKLLCLAFQFLQLFLVLWRKYPAQEVKRRETGAEVHLAKSVRNDGVFSNSQWLCVLAAPSRGGSPSVGKMRLLFPKRPPEDSQNSLLCSQPSWTACQTPVSSPAHCSFKKICIFPCKVWKSLS